MVIDILSYVLDAVGISSIFAAVVNKDYNNKFVNGLVKIINCLGMNIWNAKNK